MCLHTRTKFNSVWQLHVAEQIEYVSLVAIRERIVSAEIEAIEITEGEGIAFVGVIVYVFRKHVVEFQLIVLAEPFPGSDCEASIERMGTALRIRNRTEVRERSGSITHGVDVVGRLNGKSRASVWIHEARQIDTLGVSEIEVSCPIGRQLLLIPKVRCVSSRIVVVAVKHRNAGLKRESSARWSERNHVR